MTHPTLITNQDGNTLLAALRAAFPEAPARTAPGLAEPAATLAEIAIATGLVSPGGLGTLAPRIENAARVRLLLGAEPLPEAMRPWRRPGDPPPRAFDQRQVDAGLTHLEAGLRRERDRLPFTAAAREHLRAMSRLLRSDKLETRRYETGFLPAKAMLLDGYDPAIIVGSSNLTERGLAGDLALNLMHRDAGIFAQAREWYDALWNDAAPYDLAAIFDEPDAEFPPWLIFLRILFQLYGDELEEETREVGEIRLANFQQHGVWRAQRILAEHGGVIIADEVGLGKTFIAGAMMEAAARRRRRVLLICPAALRDTTWDRFLNHFNIGRFVQCVSYDQFARADMTGDWGNNDPDAFDLIVIDEAHNYRNPDAPSRAAVLRRLLAGPRRDLVLLTATPVNNSLWDLYHLMFFFLKQNGALAAKGIVDLGRLFREAAAQDPANLSPDLLFPAIDAVTVKRTRAFVKKFYADATIVGLDKVERHVVFPKAVASRIDYDLDRAAPGLFDAVADALDPVKGARVVAFARYAPDAFLRSPDADESSEPERATGLLRSGLLKRFESSAEAFRLSLARMEREHATFLDALGRGKVITTRFLRELAADGSALDALLDSSEEMRDATDYDVPALRAAVERDRAILRDIAAHLGTMGATNDPKLDAVVEELARIVAQARGDAATDADERRNRKVLLFSYFSDTVQWLRHALADRIARDPRLHAYRGRIVAVAGGDLEGEDVSRAKAVWGFAPQSSDAPPRHPDEYDLLIATDVLSEGMNLQQCRNIINYDLPWNPMRLVQRHGRIDRIGSPHPRVFLRSVFPANRLDALLTLEARIMHKLAQASRSIGVATSPLQGGDGGGQVFAEARAEIERLANGDPTIYEQAGTAAATQSGEEYRQRLRVALDAGRDAIVALPGGAGSGFRRGRQSGVVFCAEVALRDSHRTFLRFVPADATWRVAATGRTERALGTCLRLADCTGATARHMPAALAARIFGFWDRARADILAEWDDLSDPANLQPRVPRINRDVAAQIRAHPPRDIAREKLTRALDILESPWPRRDEAALRQQFREPAAPPGALSERMAAWVLATGLEPFAPPAPLPPIASDAVRLVCWMAIEAEASAA